MPQEQSKSRRRSILARSSSLLMSLRAMARVWSGVSRCLVSGTSFPLMRARNTSPALIWRSEAPRSTAALMIFSMLLRLRSTGRGRGVQEEAHPSPHFAHRLLGKAARGGRAIGQDLLHAARVGLQLERAGADRRERRDHVVGQHALAVETAPPGTAAVLRHQRDGLGRRKVLVQMVEVADLRRAGILLRHPSRIGL